MNAEPQRLIPAPPHPTGTHLEVSAGSPTTRRQRLALVIGVCLVFVLALQLFSAILLPFVVAAGIAYFLDPPCSRLVRLGIPRALAAVLLIVALMAACLLFALLLYPLILAQIGLFIGRVPSYVTSLRAWASEMIIHLQDWLGSAYVDEKLRDLVGGQAGAMVSFIGVTLSRIVGGGFAIFNVVSLILVTPIVAFYMLRDWRAMIQRIDSWLPRRYLDVLRAQFEEIDRVLAAWLRGQALCCLVLAAFYAVALSAVGLDLGLIVGITAGFLSFIPYVGTITGGLISLGLAVAQFPTWSGVAEVGGVYLVGNILEGYVIYPRFLGDRVQLHAVWVIFALFAGGEAFGFLGVLLAVPVAAAIGVLARFWLRRYLRSPLYSELPSP